MRIEMPSGVIEGAAKYRKLVVASFAWAAPVSFDVHHLAVEDATNIVFADWTIRARRRDDDVIVEWRGLSVCELRDGRIAWWREHHLSPPAPIDRPDRTRVGTRQEMRAADGPDAGGVDLGEEPEHRVVERVRGLGHQAVGGAAQHVEARRGDQLGHLLGVAERSERVLGAGDHERRARRSCATRRACRRASRGSRRPARRTRPAWSARERGRARSRTRRSAAGAEGRRAIACRHR